MTSLVELANFKQNLTSFGSKMSYLHINVDYLMMVWAFSQATLVELIKFVKFDQIRVPNSSSGIQKPKLTQFE